MTNKKTKAKTMLAMGTMVTMISDLQYYIDMIDIVIRDNNM